MRRLNVALAIVFLTTIVADIASAGTLTYVLQPGATITPCHGSPTGPSEPLSGTFSWQRFDSSLITDAYVFDTTALDFESASYHLTLNTTPANDVASTVVFSPQEASFGAAVDATGLYTTPLRMVNGVAWGTYEGTAASPTTLTYTDIVLFPTGAGGNWAAQLSFTAILVPEPSALDLLGIGAVGLSAYGWRKRSESGLRSGERNKPKPNQRPRPSIIYPNSVQRGPANQQ